jgi:methionyl-tRNA synthetase
MSTSQKNKTPFYVTTSIAYVNGTPHVGFAMESIEADVLARWAKKNGRETFFCTGTDEHGEKIQRTAEDQGTTPQAICDKNSEAFRSLGKTLNISNDFFIRTSDQEVHWPSAQKIWSKMEEKGDIEKREYTAQYCYGCEAFLTEKDLDEDGNCPLHKRPPETISEENYFFKLSKYSEKIAKLIETKELEIIPHFRKNEILQMAKSGFHDVSFSRPSKKLPWGIPVPNDETQNMYVWCDALTNYISAVGYGKENPPLRGGSELSEQGESNTENTSSQLPPSPPLRGGDLFQKYWNNAEVVHVIGKDILRFHAGIWIGMLLSAGEKTPDKIFVHGFLTSEGHKMSKSLGNVVDPFGEVEKYGTDALRYFLLREVPIGQDADFSRKRFEEIYQAHLANGLGNLVSRVYNLCQRSEVFVPTEDKFITDETRIFLHAKQKNVEKKMEGFVLHEALSEIFTAIDFCDQKINEIKPWDLIKTDPLATKGFLGEILKVVLWIGDTLLPFLPETGEKIQKIFGVHPPLRGGLGGSELHEQLPLNPPLRGGSSTFGELEMLFPRLEKLNLPKPDSVETNCNSSLQNKNIQFTITPQAQQAGIVAEYVLLDNIAVKKTPRGMQKFLKKEVKAWLEKGGKDNPQWRERVDSQDQIKIDLGFSAEKNINAAESLANLAEKNGKLPNVSNLVDLYNIISLKHGLSAGAHDTAYLSENVKMDITTGDETFEPMQGKEHMDLENNPLKKGEYAFFISDNEIGCRFDSAQCEASKISEGNKNVLIYFQSVQGKEQWAKEAMEEFLELLKEFDLM